MPLSYKKLFVLMEQRGIKKIDLRKKGISPTIVDRLVKNSDVNTSTILRLCEILDCQPGDIMERIGGDGFTHLTPTRNGAKKLQGIEVRQQQKQQKKNGS